MDSTKFNGKFSPKSCINSANYLIELCELTYPRISSIQDINSHFLTAVFEIITHQTIPDLCISDSSITEANNIQAIIDTLSFDVLGLSLSHITGEDVVSGNLVTISNLLEVFESIVIELFPEKSKKKLKARKDVGASSSGDFNSFESNEAVKTSSKSQNSMEENIPPKLERKLCRKTLRNDHNLVTNRKVQEFFNEDHAKKRNFKYIGNKSPLKRKHSKPVPEAVKRPHTEDIEQLYDHNFEKKVKSLMLSSKATPHAHQMKKLYLRNMNTPLKRKSIPVCTKSFLLPYNLRPKTATQKIQKRKGSTSKMKLEPSMSGKRNHENLNSSFIQSVLDEFPGFQFPKNTQSLLTRCYYHHVSHMHRQLKDTLLKKPSTVIQTENATKDQLALSRILEKDIKERKILEEVKEHKMLENRIRCNLRDARLQSAKLRQYFDEFHRAMSKKLQKRNFSEEVLIERTFKEILAIQKEKVRQLCNKVKETDEQDAKQHRQYLSALKNLYQDQLTLLSEFIDTEQIELLEQRKAQNLAVRKMNQELRKKLQRNVNSLQKDVLKIIEDIHFRELDAQTFINSFHQQSS